MLFHYAIRTGKKPAQFAGNFTGSNGASRNPPSLPWALLEEAWEKGKDLKKPSWREMRGCTGSKEQAQLPHKEAVGGQASLSALLPWGVDPGNRRGDSRCSFWSEPLRAGATLGSHKAPQNADHCLQTSVPLPDFCEGLGLQYSEGRSP